MGFSGSNPRIVPRNREIPRLGDGGAGEDEDLDVFACDMVADRVADFGRCRQTLGRRVVGGRRSKLKLAFDGVGEHVHDPCSFRKKMAPLPGKIFGDCHLSKD